MPGYYVHLAACGGNLLKNRSFELGVEAPDMLKKHVKCCGGILGARVKYESLRTKDMPDYSELQPRIEQKEKANCDDGLHYGLSSKPNVEVCWNSLTKKQKANPFFRGYVWHLLSDYIMYSRLNIDAKFQKFLDANQGHPNIEELIKGEVERLHSDWNRTNAWVRDTYPEVSLTDEIMELGVVQFINEGTLIYVDWNILKETIDYLRSFDPLNGDMEKIISTVLRSI